MTPNTPLTKEDIKPIVNLDGRFFVVELESIRSALQGLLDDVWKYKHTQEEQRVAIKYWLGAIQEEER